MKFNGTTEGVDVYPVGVLSDMLAARRALTVLHRPSLAKEHLGRAYRHAWRHIRARDWHGLRQTFNGYLAEPNPWPTPALTRCGRGWTKASARRSLNRRMRDARKADEFTCPHCHVRFLDGLHVGHACPPF